MKYLSLTIDSPNGSVQIQGSSGIPTGGLDKLIDILQAFIYLFFTFAIVFALLVLIYSGWLWMTSAGDKQKIASAKQRMTYALVGLIVVFLSFFIVNFVTGFFGINIVTNIP